MTTFEPEPRALQAGWWLGTEQPVVEITRRRVRGGPEGVIEEIRRYADIVEVDLLLSNGTEATALLPASDWDWLELRLGDIVPVRAPGPICVNG